MEMVLLLLGLKSDPYDRMMAIDGDMDNYWPHMTYDICACFALQQVDCDVSKQEHKSSDMMRQS